MSVLLTRATTPITASQWTEGAITLAISSGGSDAATLSRPARIVSGDHSAEPFATPQAAYDALPRGLAHDVLLTQGAGTFAGFIAAGFVGNGKVRHIGSTSLAAVTTGVNAGTAGSGTSSTSMNKPAAAANWTAADLRGKWLKITAGGGSSGDALAPTLRAIKSNTTTAIGVDAIAGLDNTSVFQVVDVTTVLTPAPGTIFGVGARMGWANCGARIEAQMLKAVENAGGFASLVWNCQSVNLDALDIRATSGYAHYAVSSDEVLVSNVLLDGILAPYACRWYDALNVVIQAAGQISSQYITNHNVGADALSCTGTALKIQDCVAVTASLNANSCAVTPLDLQNIHCFRIGSDGLTGSNGTPTRGLLVSRGGQFIITGATIAGSSSDQFELEGRAGSYAELSGANSGTYVSRGSNLHWGSTGYTVYETKLRVEGGEPGDDFDEFVTHGMVVGGTVKQYGIWQNLDPAYKEIAAHAGGGQGSATVVGFRDTYITTVTTTGDSVRLLSGSDVSYAGGIIGSVANNAAKACDLFPPSGGKLYLNGTSQGTNTALRLAPGDYLVWLARNDLDYNVWVVSSLLTGNTTDTDTLVLGSTAGHTLTSGIRNILLGGTAGYSMTSGSENVCIGWHAASGATTMSNSVVIGSRAGLNLTMTGDSNVAVGYGAMVSGDGNSNTAVGQSALQQTIGSNNVGIGQAAGGGITSGSNNTVIGRNALNGATVTGSANIVIGQGAGSSLGGTDSNNVCIANSGVLGDNGIIRIGLDGTHTHTKLTGAVSGHLEDQNVQAGTTYTFQASDTGKVVIFTAATAVTATVPQTMTAGWHCRWEQRGLGQVDFSGTAVTAATLRNRQSQTKSAGQYAVGGLACYTSGTPAEVTLFGDTGA